jgi:glycosyltransferase involved in cell wall biosynthesis
MKIAFIIYSGAVISGKSNGVRSQAITWKSILEKHKMHSVDLVDSWGVYDWSKYNAIHIFGYDLSLLGFVSSLYKYNENIFISPIIDSTQPYWKYKFASFNGVSKLRLVSVNYVLKKSMNYIKGVCVRSEHESGYFATSLNTPCDKVYNIPLSYGIELPEDINEIIINKHNFCLHVSSLYQERKNVKRLIEAAKKYNFKLKLVGNTGNAEQTKMVKSWVDKVPSVELLGFVSYAELIDLYKKAKVFALPSTCEGVGIVALDAAVYGNNIAITNIPGPQEYYPNIATVKRINPFDIDEIGQSVVELLKTNNTKKLYAHISLHNNEEKLCDELLKMYN